MSDDDGSERESLEESTRKVVSNLQRLSEAIGGLLAGSGELLARLQRILSGTTPAATGTGEPEAPETPPRPGRDDGRDV